jgi:sugar lactone lactonase YvrE
MPVDCPDSLEGPNGIAFPPDELTLYVGNWDESAKVVVRYELRERAMSWTAPSCST